MQGWFMFLYKSSLKKILFFKLHWIGALKNIHMKLSIYKGNLLMILLEFILTVLDPPTHTTTTKYSLKF